MTEQQAIQKWKELKVTSVEFNFSCGGDSMNDTDIIINTEEGTIQDDELSGFIDNETYNRVEFYVNSDGHYQGEAGTVYIELNNDDEEEEYLTFSKSSETEWNESFMEEVLVPLSDKEVAFINENVLNFNGGDGSQDTTTVYKRDVFLDDEAEALIEGLEAKISKAMEDYVPSNDEGEQSDWFTFNTTENNLTINEAKELVVEYHGSATVYKEGD